MKKKGLMIATGLIIGAIAVALVALGNPANMGFCIACFIRDIAGALKLQTAAPVGYMRPEIIGMVLGSAIMAFVGKEFKSSGGSAPLTRFILGFFMMIGALMFLGCPLRMLLRIGGGDLNAIVGLVGFIVGVLVGIYFLKQGFGLKRSYALPKAEKYLFPAVMLGFLVILLFIPALLRFSEEGPGSMAAPIAASLIAGLIMGALGQRTRFCSVGAIRDSVLFRNFDLLILMVSLVVAVIVGNLITGNFNLGFEGQPVAHTDGIWNALGMALVGWAGVLLGGCPIRQTIMSGEGNSDAAIVVVGMLVGAAFAHNFGLASSGEGPTFNGQVAVVIGFIVVLAVSLLNASTLREKISEARSPELDSNN